MLLRYTILFLFFISCRTEKLESVLEDLSPPTLLEVKPISGSELELVFDKEIKSGNLDKVSPDWGSYQLVIHDKAVTITTDSMMDAGAIYHLYGSVNSKMDNELQFLVRYFPINENPAGLVLNEVQTAKGTKTNDSVELRVVKGGSTAGYTLYIGSSSYYTSLFQLPNIEVETGDYITVHYAPSHVKEEVNETTDKTLATASQSSDESWDLWLDEVESISGKNGVISLYDRREGSLVDLFIYSDRKNNPTDKNLGWTSTTIKAVQDVSNRSQWEQTGDIILPEDAFDASKTTATRTMNRWESEDDLNVKSNWYIVDTSNNSIGFPNSTVIYK